MVEEKEDPYWDDETCIVDLMTKREEVRDRLREEKRQAERRCRVVADTL